MGGIFYSSPRLMSSTLVVVFKLTPWLDGGNCFKQSRVCLASALSPNTTVNLPLSQQRPNGRLRRFEHRQKHFNNMQVRLLERGYSAIKH